VPYLIAIPALSLANYGTKKMLSKKLKQIAPAAALALATVTGQAAAAPIFDAANGHYYEAVTFGGNNWAVARDTAAAMSFTAGPTTYQGHLVTITSLAEQNFIVANLPSALGSNSSFGYWLGGFSTTSGVFQWVTGEAFSYTNWNAGEPNFDSPPSALHFFGLGSVGKWNDAAQVGYNFGGYIVEYEAVSTNNNVPEPATLALLAVGLAGIGAAKRKRA
jgi:Lectin C-type domain/PEP-CTERM motif